MTMPLRLPLLAIACLAVSTFAAETTVPTWPLWDGKESIEQYAKRVSLPPTKTLDLGSGVNLELVLIPAGKFVMGTPEREKPIVGQIMLAVSGGLLLVSVIMVLVRARKQRRRPQYSLRYLLFMVLAAAFAVWGGVRWWQSLQPPASWWANEHPDHEVTLSNPYYMGKFTVTQEQYQQIMGTNPSSFQGKDNPVEMVSWNDTQQFCKRLSDSLQIAIHLPTESEWEYACRAGTRTRYYSGDSEEDLNQVAWHSNNSNDSTHPVGGKAPNRFGLYDMHGNVFQWCHDWLGKYPAHAIRDPQGSAEGITHGVRGGCWLLPPALCRAASRIEGVGDRHLNGVGFRIVMPVSMGSKDVIRNDENNVPARQPEREQE